MASGRAPAGRAARAPRVRMSAWCAISKRTSSPAIASSKAWRISINWPSNGCARKPDQRRHGTVKEVVAERFVRESSWLNALPATRFDTAYRERRVVAWDGYIEVRGNRYSVPGELCGALVEVRIGLDGGLTVYNGDGQVVARHRPSSTACSIIPAPSISKARASGSRRSAARGCSVSRFRRIPPRPPTIQLNRPTEAPRSFPGATSGSWRAREKGVR